MPRSSLARELKNFTSRPVHSFKLNSKRCTTCITKRSPFSTALTFPEFNHTLVPTSFSSKLQKSRSIETSSFSANLTNFNDAFSETNQARLIKQLGRMKPSKSFLASCSEEAAVFVPFCLVNSVPSVLLTLRSSRLNSHRGEVRWEVGPLTLNTCFLLPSLWYSLCFSDKSLSFQQSYIFYSRCKTQVTQRSQVIVFPIRKQPKLFTYAILRLKKHVGKNFVLNAPAAYLVSII